MSVLQRFFYHLGAIVHGAFVSALHCAAAIIRMQRAADMMIPFDACSYDGSRARIGSGH